MAVSFSAAGSEDSDSWSDSASSDGAGETTTSKVASVPEFWPWAAKASSGSLRAPSDSRYSTMSVFPAFLAQKSGVRLKLFTTLTSAPCATKSLAISTSPDSAARSKAVLSAAPSREVNPIASTSAPASKRIFTLPGAFLAAARWSGVMFIESRSRRSAPQRISSERTSVWF